MKIEYQIKRNSVYIDDGESILSYGIKAYNSSVFPHVFLSEFKDVSVDFSFAKRIAELLNSSEVELCHFYDVVIDELNR